MSELQKPLKERMKRGELYVIFSGLDHEGLGFLCYGFPATVPRIYSKDALDPRVSEHHPICRSVESAQKRLGPNTRFVVLPLSAIIEFADEFEVRRWAMPQRSVDPQIVREYISNWKSSQPVCRNPQFEEYRKTLPKRVAQEHERWIDKHVGDTLAELLEYLEFVRYEMQRYEPDDLIVDHFDQLGVAAEYLAEWDEPHSDDDEPHDFEYRLANLDEDIERLDEVIDMLGAEFKLADLLKLDEDCNASVPKLAG